LEIDPKYAYAWSNKGLALQNLGKYEEAIRCYDEALEINPKYAYAWNNKGDALNGLGKFQEAKHCYDKAFEVDPKTVNAWYEDALNWRDQYKKKKRWFFFR
jgi:tetratricopeptide (TPR) repeat protein